MWHAREEQRSAFTRLVQQHQDRVFRLAVRMVGSDAAEDVAQQAFLRAWAGLHSFEAKASFGTWLYRLAINCCLDYLRHQRRFRELPLESADPSSGFDLAEHVAEALDQHERASALAWALDQLPTEDRLLLHLRISDKLAYDEIAEVLGVKPGTVGSRLYRARARLHALVLSCLAGGTDDVS